MTRLLAGDDPVRVYVDGQGRPLRFAWQGFHYHVEQVQQRWQVDTDWWDERGRVWRSYWAVTTAEGLFCVLYFDRLTEKWFVSRAYD